MDVVGGGQGYARAPGQLRQFPVAGGVALQEILLEFHVHPAGAVPVQVGPEQLAGVLAAALRKQLGKRPVPAPGEQHHPPGVFGQARRVQPGFPTVGGVGQGEQAGDVGVARTGPGQQHQAGPIVQGQFAAGDGPYAQAFGQPGEFQRPAQVGVGQGQGLIPVFHGLGQQLVDVGGPLSKGVEALDVEFHVSGCHGRSPDSRRPGGTSGPPARPGTGSPPRRPPGPPGSRSWSLAGASTTGRSTTGLLCGPPGATAPPAAPPPVGGPVPPAPSPGRAGTGASCLPVRNHRWGPASTASPGPGARGRPPPPGTGRACRPSGPEAGAPPRPAVPPGRAWHRAAGPAALPTPR